MGLDHPLRATSRLADNSWAILATVVDALAGVGLTVEVDPDLDPGDADLLFACGLLTRELIDVGAPLEVVAAPVFPAETAPVYRSILIARADQGGDLDDVATGRIAVNDYGSWSGWFGLLAFLRSQGVTLPRDERRVETGGHLASIAAVASGNADMAAIDSSVWHHHGNADGTLRVIATSPDWPAPPFSVGATVDSSARGALLDLAGIVAATTADYDEMLLVRRSFS